MRNAPSKSVINILLRLMKETSRWRWLITSSMGGVEGLVAGMTYLAPLVLRRTRKQHIESALEKHNSHLGFFNS